MNLFPPPPQLSGSKLISEDLSQVFIVHGHDDITKMDVSRYIASLGLKPIILHQQASGGDTIIEKIEAYTDVGFAIVLYTSCDVGSKNGQYQFKPRARQNVVLEHGFLLGKLNWKKVVALVKKGIELPSDVNGIIYVELDDQGKWKAELCKEMSNAGLSVAPPPPC